MLNDSKSVITRTLFTFVLDMNARLCLHCVCLRPVTCGLIAFYVCEWVFDVWDVCKRYYLFRVFDPGRLLVGRVGNLNELTSS